MPAPGQFLPRKSGAHRIACIALYRALLIQCPRIPLPDDIQFPGSVNPIKHFIRKRFKKNAFHASPRIVVPALKTGYAAEQLLRTAASGHAPSITQIHAILHEMHARSSHSRAITPPMPPPLPKPAAYPNAPKVLESRPLPLEKLTGGRRHVPIMTYTDFLPFLRFKSPQSPHLSRVLGQKLKNKQKRLDFGEVLGEEIAVGEFEEEWEEHLKHPFGMSEVKGVEGKTKRIEGIPEKRLRDGRLVLSPRDYHGEEPWQMQSWLSRGVVFAKMAGEVEKAQRLGGKMLEVVDREKELWASEKAERRAAKERKRELRLAEDGKQVNIKSEKSERPLVAETP